MNGLSVKYTLTDLNKCLKKHSTRVIFKYIQRKRKVFIWYIVYTLLYMSANNCGYQEALLNMKLQNMIDNGQTSISNHSDTLMDTFSEEFFSLNDQIINKFFKGKTGRRTYCNDLTITYQRSLDIYDGFRKVENNKYCQGLPSFTNGIDT